MDWLILFRIVHIFAAMSWFGGAVLARFFLQPTAQALGPYAQPFMDHLVRRRRMNIFFPIVAGLTILSGAALYWHDSSGLDAAWIATPQGIAFTIGGLAAIAAFVGGAVLIGPSVAEQTAVQNELAGGGEGVPNEAQQLRLDRAARRLQLADRIDLPLLLLAGLSMAVARYLSAWWPT